MLAPLQNKNDALKILASTWADRPEACLGGEIIDYISENTHVEHIPFNFFIELAKKCEISDLSVVMNVVNYLTGARLNLLSAGFEYIEDEVVEPLDAIQVKAAENENIHPLTGEFDERVSEKIYMFFYPSNLAKDILGGA